MLNFTHDALQAVVHGVTALEVVRQEAATHEKHFYPGPNCASSLYFKIAAIEDIVGVAALESWAAVNLLPVLTAAVSDVMARFAHFRLIIRTSAHLITVSPY